MDDIVESNCFASLRKVLEASGVKIPDGLIVKEFVPLVRIDEKWGGIFCLTEDVSYCAHYVTSLFELFLINHEENNRCVGFRIASPRAILTRIVAILDALNLPREIITLENVLRLTQVISHFEAKEPIPLKMLEKAYKVARIHTFVLTREQYEPFLTTPTN